MLKYSTCTAHESWIKSKAWNGNHDMNRLDMEIMINGSIVGREEHIKD